jgi:hypothetical protein
MCGIHWSTWNLANAAMLTEHNWTKRLATGWFFWGTRRPPFDFWHLAEPRCSRNALTCPSWGCNLQHGGNKLQFVFLEAHQNPLGSSPLPRSFSSTSGRLSSDVDWYIFWQKILRPTRPTASFFTWILYVERHKQIEPYIKSYQNNGNYWIYYYYYYYYYILGDYRLLSCNIY